MSWLSNQVVILEVIALEFMISLLTTIIEKSLTEP